MNSSELKQKTRIFSLRMKIKTNFIGRILKLCGCSKEQFCGMHAEALDASLFIYLILCSRRFPIYSLWASRRIFDLRALHNLSSLSTKFNGTMMDRPRFCARASNHLR